MIGNKVRTKSIIVSLLDIMSIRKSLGTVEIDINYE